MAERLGAALVALVLGSRGAYPQRRDAAVTADTGVVGLCRR